jgi:hypothetical protein
MNRPELPTIPSDLNGIIFKTQDGEMGTLMRENISPGELTLMYAKLMEMLDKDTQKEG